MYGNDWIEEYQKRQGTLPPGASSGLAGFRPAMAAGYKPGPPILYDRLRLQARRDVEEAELREEALRSWPGQDEPGSMPAFADGLASAGMGASEGWKAKHIKTSEAAGTDMDNGGAAAQAPPYVPAPTFEAPAVIDGNEYVTVVGIQSVGAHPTLRMSDGRVVPMDQAAFGDYEAQAIYETAAEFKDSNNANRFLQIYHESGWDAPDFLQLYLDIYRADIQGRAGAKGVKPNGLLDHINEYTQNNQGGQDGKMPGPAVLRDKPIDLRNVATSGTLYLSDGTLDTINDLQNGDGLPPLQSVDLASNQTALLANSDESGIMETAETYGQNQPVQSGESETAEMPGTDDYLNAVLSPQQREQKDKVTSLIAGMLSDEQKRRIEKGEDFSTIIGELDPKQQEEIVASVAGVELMTGQQLMDFMYLQNVLLEDLTIAEKQAVLQHLKENNGQLTPAELKKIAADASGGDAEGEYFREVN